MYDCAGVSCSIGTTTARRFTEKFPRCLNGILTIRKQGYVPIHLPLTADEREQNIDLKMYPEKELRVDTRKYLVEKQGVNWKIDSTKFYPTSPDENLVVSIIKMPEEFEAGYSAVVDFAADEKPTVKLVPGKYKLNINGFTNKEIIIPKDKRCTEPEYFLFIEVVPEYCYYVPQEPMLFDERNPFPSTMAEIEFTITPEKLYNSHEILITYLSLALDKVPEQQRKIEDLQQINDIRAYSTARQDLLKQRTTSA